MTAGCALRRFATMACGVFALLVAGALAGAQPAPNYATLLAAPDRAARSTARPTSVAIRCRFSNSPDCGRG